MRAAETLFVILLVCSSCGGDTGADPSGYTVQVQGDGAPAATLHVEVARTFEERRVGLMDRQSLPSDAGMLFVFGGPSRGGFWMKNTYVPLDIAYLGADGTIQEIRAGIPLDETPIVPAQPYYFVLEVNRGWFAGNGFGVGDRVLIPVAITSSAAPSRAPPDP